MLSIDSLIKQTRTYRRFDESVAIDRLQIVRWLDIVRQTPSARNAQPLKYIIITDTELCHEITAKQHWASMLPEWDGPSVGERPRAYLLQILDTDIAPAARFDEGIQLQALGLLATEAGYGTCIFGGHGKAELSVALAYRPTSRSMPSSLSASPERKWYSKRLATQRMSATGVTRRDVTTYLSAP